MILSKRNNKRKKKRKEGLLVKVLLSILVLMIVAIIGTVVLFVVATIPQRQARQQATQIAQQHAHLTTVENFYTFSRATTYFTVTGKDNEGRNIIVIVPAAGDQITVLNAAEGNNEGQARTIIAQKHPNLTIVRSNLGIFNKRPTWEITARNAQGKFEFFLIDWASGQLVSNTNEEEEG